MHDAFVRLFVSTLQKTRRMIDIIDIDASVCQYITEDTTND